MNAVAKGLIDALDVGAKTMGELSTVERREVGDLVRMGLVRHGTRRGVAVLALTDIGMAMMSD